MTTARTAWSALPRGPIGGQAAATLGLALLSAGRPAEAIGPFLDALAAPPPGVEGELRLALGRALLSAGRPVEALQPLAEAARPGPSPTRELARWLEAEALLDAGRVTPAIRRLEELLAHWPDDAAARRGRLLLAGGWRLAGREAEALAAYRALALDEPDLPEGAQAAAALQAWAEAGGAGARLGGGDRLQRAERLLQRGRPEAALADAEVAGTDGTLAPGQATLVRALALAGLGRLTEASALAAPLATAPEPGVRRGARWLLARSAARAGRVQVATGLHAEVARERAPIPGMGDRRSREVGDQSAYLAAWLWYEAGDFRKAMGLLDAFVRTHPGSPRADDARWLSAWSAVRAGDRRLALRRLARLEAGPLAEAALYWQGRLGEGSPRALERLRRAAIAGGDGWYGWLARRRLVRLGVAPLPGPAVPAPRPGPDRPWAERPGAADLERLRTASALLGLGARDRGLLALRAATLRGAPKASAAEACRLATFAGEPGVAFRTARDLLGQSAGTERWLYPAAFAEVLLPAAHQAGVDEALLLAVVRRESGFRGEVRSAAGALGLGQLLPRTAERLGLLAQLSADPAERLGDPATSLPLAALYLGLLLDRFGSDAAAVAAYNAGPSPPLAWSTAGAGQPLDEWVENIPFKETRVYLKVVLASREVYRRLAGLPPRLDPDEPMPAPVSGVAF